MKMKREEYSESQEWARQQKYWQGYPEFKKADQPNRQVIMAEAKALMEIWFEEGVTYTETGLPGFRFFGISRAYNNEPEKLHGLLQIAYGKIRANIMNWKRIPEYLWPQMLMWTPAIPLAPFGLKGEFKAICEDEVNGPAYEPVLLTEGSPSKERAELIGNSWYDTESHRLYGFIGKIYVGEIDQYKRPMAEKAIDRYLETEQMLKQLRFDQARRIEYYACSDFEYEEVANMLRSIGVVKSPEAVRKSFKRVKTELSALSSGI